MKIGYARKSTHLQDVAHQVDELTKAGCEQIYQDQTSRSLFGLIARGRACSRLSAANFSAGSR